MTIRPALPLLAAAAFASLHLGCASSAAVKAAEKGDYAALKQHLADEMKAGKLDGGEARDVARAVVQRELTTAKGDDSIKRVEELRACVPSAQGMLEDRAGKSDEGGAMAALVLLDARLDTSRWASKADTEDPYWRAVGARSLTDSSRGDRRRELFLDVFVEVRKAALRAAVDAADPGDLPLLLDTVRVDPDESARSTAARGAGLLGGESTVLALKDRWPSSSDPVRVAIVGAWASQASYRAGGREQLFWAVETERGSAAISAATLLMGHGDREAAAGRAALVRAIDDGPAPARVMAINLANLDDEPQKQSVLKASESGEGPVRVAALSRLVALKDQRQKALDELGSIAAGDSLERNAARTALARARDRRVVQLLADDTRAPEGGVRVWAAGELASMKEFHLAAQVLADDEPSVRTRAACAILSVPH